MGWDPAVFKKSAIIVPLVRNTIQDCKKLGRYDTGSDKRKSHHFERRHRKLKAGIIMK
eukprot:TRINITY_DN838_c0_g1_i1.p2 TRINITY_DN838_c0_g1~~TRINITY_DN838_c0_g1_i1.p2  ORF type:complete len:58 (-),score=4.40 TRINITY_DN838_c0_g1_i1:57-230(-)